MLLAMMQATPTIDYPTVINAVLNVGIDFAQNGTTGLAMSIFWICITFHLIQGSIEIVNQEKSRLFNPHWWMRIFLVLAMFTAYQTFFVSMIQRNTQTYFQSYSTSWVTMWSGQEAVNLQQKTSATDNRNLEEKTANDATPSAPGQEHGMFVRALFTVASWTIGILAAMLCTIAGEFLLLILLMQGFFCLAMNALVIAFGPLAIAFCTHERTEGIFWAWLKAGVVYGLLYLPRLSMGGAVAGSVFAVVTSSITSAGFSYQDGTDISIHFILSILAPICTIPMVMAVPGFISGVMQLHTGAGPSAMPAALGAIAGAGASEMSAKGGGKPPGGGSGSGGGGDGDGDGENSTGSSSSGANSAEEARG